MCAIAIEELPAIAADQVVGVPAAPSAFMSIPAPQPTPPGERIVKNGVTCMSEQVPMRDGARLYTEIYSPAAGDAVGPVKRPVILIRGPYGATGMPEGCFIGQSGAGGLVSLGFVAVIQSVRGTGSSEGEFMPGINEHDDGIDLMNWAAAQPWSNGRVGMTSGSYLGWTQWQAAPGAPAALKALSPMVSGGDLYDDAVLRNGVFDPFFQIWAQQFVGPTMHKRMAAQGVSPEQIAASVQTYQTRAAANKQWIDTLPLASTWDEETRQYIPFLWELYRHPTYDSFWRKQNAIARADKITVPVLIGASWYDLFTKGTIDSYLALVEHGGSPATRRRSMLVVDCCGHSPSFAMPAQPGQIDWGPNRLNYEGLRNEFLLHYVAGRRDSLAAEPSVQVTVLVPPDQGLKGDTFIYRTTAWPAPGSRTARYYLASNGKANTLNGDGILSRVGRSGGAADSFSYDPQNPVPTIGLGASGALLDQTVVESRPDVLIYTAAPETSERLIMGKVSIDFWAMTDGRDTDFTAKLVDVHPDGFAHILAERIVRGSFRKGPRLPPKLLTPNNAYPYHLDLGYIASVLKPAHRLRLEISSSNFSKYARNLNTGASNMDTAETRVARNTVLHDLAHPSFLTMPFAPKQEK